jgi:hypothetical protein
MTLFGLKLFLAHLLGDFVLQPDAWVKNKNSCKIKSPYLYAHIAVHSLALLILLQFDLSYWKIILTIILSHFIIDVSKLYLQNKKNARWLFVLDQLLHIAVLLAIIHQNETISFHLKGILQSEIIIAIGISVIAVTFVSAIVMRLIMDSWNLKEDSKTESLPQAGKYIGMLERLFVFCFVVLGQWQGIGFLIAAKSVFRFSDLSRAKDRKLTEYILIGTLLSFGLAIGIGLIYTYFESSFM